MNPREASAYRDPALDGILRQTSNSNSSSKRSSRHNRQTSTVNTDSMPPLSSNSKNTSDLSRAPTIIHPNNDPTRTGGLQRSFSQRARGRPFADEAFADDFLDETVRAVDTTNPHDSKPEQSQHQLLPHRTSARMSDVPPATRQQMIQDNIYHAAKSADMSASSHGQRKRSIMDDYDDENNEAGLARVPTLRETADLNEQRDWAPDRSPLQKLEVTLGDISKEEKRARVKEAEMLHREKTRSQKTNGRSVDVAARQPATIEDVGVVRNLSNAHKDRLMHSTVIESRKPDIQRLNADRQGFEYQSAALPPRSVTITRRSQRHSSQPQADANADRTQTYPKPAQVASRSLSASQPPGRDWQNLGHPKTNTTARRPLPFEANHLPTAMDRNASHKAALHRLEGANAATRTTQRSLDEPFSAQIPGSSAPPSQPSNQKYGKQPGGPSSAAWTATPSSNIQTTPGFQGSPGLRSIDSPILADKSNPAQRQKRRSSVSFKEPFERRRPVDEWKAAETARLVIEDFSREPMALPEIPDNKAWWEQESKNRPRTGLSQPSASLSSSVAIDDRTAECKPRLLFRCGPLLRYTGIRRSTGTNPTEFWRGTIMLVTKDSQSSYEKNPILRIFSQPKSLYSHSFSNNDHDQQIDEQHSDPLAGCTKISRVGRTLYVKPTHNLPHGRDLSKIETDDGLFESTPPMTGTDGEAITVAPVAPRLHAQNGESVGRHKEISGVRLYADPDRDVTFWLFKLEIQLGAEQQHVGYRINGGAASGFWVPATGEVMHIMFHSCNGFSVSVKPDDLSGPDPLWRDVLSAHQSHPFHVMLGGGDQIYNDKVMNQTHHFAQWTANKNPHHKHHAPLDTEMKEELETFYLENYCSWFSQGLFGMAASQIPMVNMWDDHDIIDGFGSYPHAFQLSPVFSGIGNIAYKYYMLFQQHSVEAMTTNDEPSWLLGYKPGPYIKQLSRSIFLDLGRPVAFLALDCRTERMKNQVISVDTCDIALERCRKEIIEGQTKHLIVLLGVPIAYPRMNWLENVLTSRAMDPVKALGRYGLLKGGFLNRFDGGVEVLDDLDDHWTAHHHKEERNEFIKELQDLAAERSVRISILGGDVHLGAIGQFYSTPRLKIPKDHDHRYMPNIISSAIVNTPPPEMLADVLNKRNKVHHLDSYTDEAMIPMFTHDVDGKKRNNKHLLPRRNWCSIAPYIPGRTPPSSRSSSPSQMDEAPHHDDLNGPGSGRRFSFTAEDIKPRGLLRRLSSRKAPPNAYDNPYRSAQPLDSRVDGSQDGNFRAGSLDDVRPGRSQPRTLSERLGLTRRTASETRQANDSLNQDSDLRLNTRDSLEPRPEFHRRPTNLSERAARKGNVPAIDADGNEFNINDHVNLEGGLDVVLNFEIDRNDPRGATEPYRLLIPGLWYDGSSDREKLDGASGLQRRPTLMGRLGFGGKQNKTADGRSNDRWEQDMSDSESDGPDGSNQEKGPANKLGLFGSLRRKQRAPEMDQGQYAERHDPEQGLMKNHSGLPRTNNDQVFHGLSGSTTPKGTPPRLDVQDSSREPKLHSSYTSPTTASFNMAPESRFDSINSQPINKKGNVLRKNSLKRQQAAGPVEQSLQVTSPTTTTTTTTSFKRSAMPQSGPAYNSAEFSAPDMLRQNSYTIGKQGASRSGVSADKQYVDTDSAYFARHHNNNAQARAISNPIASHPPQTSYSNFSNQMSGSPQARSQGSTRHDRNESMPPLLGNLQTQQVGVSTSQQPQRSVLRGNGILGRLGVTRSYSANHDPERSVNYPPNSSHFQQQSPPEEMQRSSSQGYNGIEAYREKPKRGGSFRDKARNFFDRVEGRRRYDDDDADSFDSQGSFSDELGEEPVHSQKQQRPAHQTYSDDEDYAYDSREQDDSGPKRGLSQRFKLGMMRMGSRKGQPAEHDSQDKGEARYY